MYATPIPEKLHTPHANSFFDDDGRVKRTGTWLTACAHIITAIVGSGVLSLAWAMAQLGWLGGLAVLFAFSFITYFTSILMANCYRCPGPIHGNRNYTYTEVVRAHLGDRQGEICGVAQYAILVGITIGYIITASISMVAVKRSNCFHKHGHEAGCWISHYPDMLIFAGIQMILCQIQNIDKISWLSILASIMSFSYSSIGVGLCIAKAAAGNRNVGTTLMGTTHASAFDKVLRSFQAVGNIAFAYSYSAVLIEIQDTLKSEPTECKEMKKASMVGVSVTSVFYAVCGSVGYAAFGSDAPGNILTGFGFYEPFWLINLANVCIAVHLIGAYQVFAQPVFAVVENYCSTKWADNRFIMTEHQLIGGLYRLNLFRLAWRSAFVIVTTLTAMIFPFFNGFLGLIGAAMFYPLSVYFPIQMHIKQAKIRTYSFTWICLNLLNCAGLAVSIVTALGSIQALAHDVKTLTPFKS